MHVPRECRPPSTVRTVVNGGIGGLITCYSCTILIRVCMRENVYVNSCTTVCSCLISSVLAREARGDGEGCHTRHTSLSVIVREAHNSGVFWSMGHIVTSTFSFCSFILEPRGVTLHPKSKACPARCRYGRQSTNTETGTQHTKACSIGNYFLLNQSKANADTKQHTT